MTAVIEAARRDATGSSFDDCLATVLVPPRRIGGRDWSGRSMVVRVVHVAYQQKTHIRGRIAPTVGAISRGDGAVYGGGGTIDSESESVATVVFADERGVETTLEVPAAVSVREGSVLRVDCLGTRTFAVTNVSGGRRATWLLGPDDFIAGTGFRKRDFACAVLFAMALAAANWPFVLAFAARPAWVLWRMRAIGSDRRALGRHMAAIASS